MSPTRIVTLCLFYLLTSCSSTEEWVSRSGKHVLLLHDKSFKTEAEKMVAAWKDVLMEEDIALTISSDNTLLEESALANISALILYQVSEENFTSHQQTSIERFGQAGGGILVVDQVVVGPFVWPWFEQLIERTSDKILIDDFSIVDESHRVIRGGELLTIPNQTLKILSDYLIGDNRFNMNQVTCELAPKDNRFTKVILDDDIYEPMELVVLPKNRKVLFLERRGKMKLYDPYKNSTTVVANFDVCIDGNYEDGLHGVALDPNYGKTNHWIYVYYSPNADCQNPNQYLSRFTFKEDSLHQSSEKVILRVEVQRETCCHSGGSVEFGPDGLLYLSTGDNTSSKESDGYTPTDERAGRAPFDAQKSSANTQDLRGKILRIRPQSDGTYTIPEGNLFASDSSKGRPEIYAMGCRNPFRIHIDQKTNWLYWGDVGPDVGQDGRYGPQSYDEFNQAKEAGNFGWPYFVANNLGYPDRDFSTDEVGALPDPKQPVNDSPNNAGASQLPAAIPSWIWYPYGASKEFPKLGSGSRSAMAGPVYYEEGKMPLSKTKFPAYYEGKLILYEWARSMLWLCTTDDQGNLVKMEDFLPSLPWSKPIDIEFGPDGSLYVLEYGNQYFMDNPDAVLSRIEFAEGNRSPVASLLIDHPQGAAPHQVHLDASNSYDFDIGDSLSFTWSIDNELVSSTESHLDYVFDKEGTHIVKVVVHDSEGGTSEATDKVITGNAPPIVHLEMDYNRSFFFMEDQEAAYQVVIEDEEDRVGEGIDNKQSSIHVSYIQQDELVEDLIKGKAVLPEGSLKYVEGYYQIAQSDCLTCHRERESNIGPSYVEVAERYAGEKDAIALLAQKIVKGGNGNWGEKMMSAHPQLSMEQAESMVKYILALGQTPPLPLSGVLQLRDHSKEEGGYVIQVAYQDRGTKDVAPIKVSQKTFLRAPILSADDFEVKEGYKSTFGENREFVQARLKHNGSLELDQIDLYRVKTIQVKIQSSVSGQVIVNRPGVEEPVGKASVRKNSSKDWQLVNIPISDIQGAKRLILKLDLEPSYFINDHGQQQASFVASIHTVRFKI